MGAGVVPRATAGSESPVKIRRRTLPRFSAIALCAAICAASARCPVEQSAAPSATGFEFINTSFENASPLYWQVDPDGTIQVYLVYDQERSAPNRANGHWHFQLQAKPGTQLTVV